MKRMFALVLTISFFLLNGCATVNHKVKDKFKPMVGTATYADVLAAMSGTCCPQPGGSIGNCDMIAIEFGNLKAVTKQRFKTQYKDGDYFSDASSVTEAEEYSVNSGTEYWFLFDKEQILRYFEYKVLSGGKTAEEASGGDEKFHDKWGKMPPSENTSCDKYFRQKAVSTAGQPEAATSVSPLEQKLNDLKALKDKKVITEEEYKNMRGKILDNFK